MAYKNLKHQGFNKHYNQRKTTYGRNLWLPGERVAGKG